MAISKVAFGSFSSGQFGNESVIGFTAQSAAGKQGEEKKKKWIFAFKNVPNILYPGHYVILFSMYTLLLYQMSCPLTL